MDAIEVLRRLAGVHELGDFVYEIRDRELKGWDGPKVIAWGAACAEAARIVKEAGGPIKPPAETPRTAVDES